FLGNHWGWHSSFLMIAIVSAIVGIFILVKLEPITAHLLVQSTRNPLAHLFKTVSQGRYLQAFLATTLLATGGFMLMPFGSAFSVNNLKISLDQLPWVYLATGISSMIVGPYLGKLSDKLGKYRLFCIGSLLGTVIVIIYCNLGETPLAAVIAINIVLFAAITMRMVSSQALASAMPDLQDRGAFMAVNNSVAQFAGGVAATIAGLIVVQTPNGGPLQHYDILGYVVATAMLTAIGLMYPIHKMVMKKLAAQAQAGIQTGMGAGHPGTAPATAPAKP
ncbi:MAG: putative permease, Major Facilitator Superfamily, partial [Fibrobacteres bacterium]|nr:putative permease, Major Facilitator Superfamily [Fibrobacterota bacterium]